MPRKSVLAERPVGGVAQTNVIWRLGIIVRSPETSRLSILHALDQKYSRLRCLLRVKGLAIVFYLGWSGHTLLIRKI